MHHNMRVSTVKFIRSLSLKQLRCHHDTTWIDLRVSKLFKWFLAVIERKSFVGCSVSELGSAVGIDVVHHMVNVRLCKFVKGRSFRQDPAHKLVIHLNRALLVRRGRIAVKDIRSADTSRLKLNHFGIGKLRASVGQNYREEPFKQLFTKLSVQIVKHVNDRLRGVGIS